MTIQNTERISPSPTYILPLPKGGGGLQEGEGNPKSEILNSNIPNSKRLEFVI